MWKIASLAFLFSLAACGSSDEKKLDSKTYAAEKKSLADKERGNGTQFIDVNYSIKRNIWGSTVVRGNLHNSATVMGFKSIRLKFLYYVKDSLVANHEEVYDDPIGPNDERHFKTKYKTPHGTDSVAISVMSVSPVEQ